MPNIKSLVYMSLIFGVLLLTSTNFSDAKEEYAPYIPGPLNGKCEACHSGSSIDAYGQDFGTVANHASDPGGAIDTIAGLDSDGDGFTNSEELSKGTFPGDPSSHPASSENVDIPWTTLVVIGISFLLVIVLDFGFNKWYFSLTVSRKDNEVKHDVIQEEKEDGVKAPRKAIQKLDEDFKAGNLEEEMYLDLRRRYLEKLGRYR